MKIIEKLIKSLEVISRKLFKMIKGILKKFMKMIKVTLKKYIEMVKAIVERFLKNLQVITDKFKRKIIKKIQHLKHKISEYEYSKLIPIIALFIEILMIGLWALPFIIFKVFGVMRTSIILNTSNFLIYRCISMPIMFLIRGFIAKSIKELMKDHCLLGLISITFTVIFFWLFF